MPSSFNLPAWLQYVVAASTVISSMGVIIALTQISITKKQFQEQLETTTNQFNLLNQGYLNLDTRSMLYSPQLAPGVKMRPGFTYNAIALTAVLENVGNTPIVGQLQSCRLFFDDVQVSEAPVETIGNFVTYPKQKFEFGLLENVYFTSNRDLLTIPQIAKIKITCKFRFSYHDFSNTHIKFIDRTLIMKQSDYGTSGIYSEIKDSF